ncbi:MAG: hypothetical protein ACRCWG_06815 [Sarcina sp.]
MSFFKNLKVVTDSISKTAGTISTNIATVTNEQTKISKLEKEIKAINLDVDAACTQIGKRYLENTIATGEMAGIDVTDILAMLDPKLSRKEELEKEVIEAKKRLKDHMILQEKAKAQEQLEKEKEKLDQALAMDVISQSEYNEKLNFHKNKVEKFDEIKKIQQQCEMGIITVKERDDKIEQLLNWE